MELYREQVQHGRYFLYEHPAYASSWQEEAVQRLIDEDGVTQWKNSTYYPDAETISEIETQYKEMI